MSLTTEQFISGVKRYPRAVLCVVLTVVFGLCVYFRSAQLPELHEHYEENSKKLDEILKNLAQGTELEGQLNELKRMTTGMEDRLMKADNKAQNYQFFYDVEQKSKATISSLQQTTVGMEGATRAKLEQFTAVGFDLTVTGTAPQVMSFLKRLEGGKFFVRFNSVTLRGNQTLSPDGVEAVLRLEVLAKKL